ncbi:threonine/serine exporter family protein [Arcticibacter svalbardensis]|nr:threonine/serine exporter family protein [Arcticibacter svalbardensis]
MIAPSPKNKEIKDLGNVLLNVGAMLLSSGASTGRTRNTISRISDSFGYSSDLLISHRTIMLTISDKKNDYFFNNLKRSAPHGVNFKLLSGISRLSWQVVEEGLSVNQINVQLSRLAALKHYPRWFTLLFVGLAGVSFCRLSDGDALDMVTVFTATVCGLFIRQEVHKMKFNPYICIFCGAFTASLIAGGGLKYGMGFIHEQALATSVLFLIPGVPLINSFSDMIDGNLNNAIVRGLNGFIISFAIGMGLLTSMLIYRF